MLALLLKGIGIGFAVAAPVGPIGLLCIRRTLKHGRLTGLASGLGAAIADSIYGIMVAAGLAITGLLVSYATALQIFGGLLIAVLGIKSLKSFMAAKTPVKAVTAPDTGNAAKAFATSFALTLSNPMTILAFIALISAIGPSGACPSSSAYILVLGVFIGSSLWWIILVNMAAFTATKLTGKITGYFDLLSGLVLLIWGLWIAGGAAYEISI